MYRYTKLNKEGFSSVETVLMVVIVAIIVFVGWLVYHSNQQANNTLNTGSNVSVVTNSSTKTAQAAAARAKNAAVGLLSFSKANASSPLKDYVDKHVNDGQFTSAFKMAVDGGTALVASASSNPIYCSGTKAPSSFKAQAGTVNGDTDMVTLTQTFAGSSTTAPGPQVTVVYANGTWSVDQYVCQ